MCLTRVRVRIPPQQDLDDFFGQQSAVYKDGVCHPDDDPCSVELVATQVSATASSWTDPTAI